MMARWRALCAAGQMLCLADETLAEECTVNLINTALAMAELPPTPEVVCLCGSTRHLAAFIDWQRILTIQGHIVLTIGSVLRGDKLTDEKGDDAQLKLKLDLLHRRKIDLADVVLVLDVEGYVGSSTADEIEYAESTGKRIIRLSKAYPGYEMPTLNQALFDTFSVKLSVVDLDDRQLDPSDHFVKSEVDRG